MRSAYVSVAALLAVTACSGGPKDRAPGQTSFISAPFPAGTGGDAINGPGGGENAGGTASPAPVSSTRQVEETDLYRLDGNRLYYLDGYRGLMVFDVTNPDQPALLGRSPIYGSPVDMYVNNGIAVVVVADWYDIEPDGAPFYGSVVRGLDATDPTNIKVLGDARLQGQVSDDRVVGNVIYVVGEDYGDDDYGWWGWWGWGCCIDGGVATPGVARRRGGAVKAATPASTPAVIVSSVSFANNAIQAVGQVVFPGNDGVFNVTANSILVADSPDSNASTSQLVYLDISDPGGAIVQRGTVTVDGAIQGWGADNGRWNLDFADGVTAHSIGQTYGNDTSGYVLAIADFTNPDAPTVTSELPIAAPGWDVAALFQPGRLYLSPDIGWYDGSDYTPFQVYDLTNPASPALAGTVDIPGIVWNILPAPDQRLFALGNDYESDSDDVTLQYLDVTNPAAPALLSSQQFGNGWAWTPAAGTFKAFTMDTTQDLVVVPYAGWDSTTGAYNNGLQLVQFTTGAETVVGAAHTKGWVERGIFVGTRLYSLADMSLAVVDYTNPNSPTVVTELALARNVNTAQPAGSSIAEVSSDWWQNDTTTSEVRVLPIAQADETTDVGTVPTVNVPGVGAEVFDNGLLSYVVTSVPTPTWCPGDPAGTTNCSGRVQRVTVLDLSNNSVRMRGSVDLPVDQWGWYGWGWLGFFWWDWFDGGDVVQVQNTALAFRRWEPQYSANGSYLDANSDLYVIDLSDPDAPKLASSTITTDPNGWWGNMQVVGGTLYTTHETWVEQPGTSNGGYVAYYADRIDLSDRTHPVVEASVNVPGLIVGGDASNPSTVYTIDYRWNGATAINDFDVVTLGDTEATLRSYLTLDGWVGNTYVVGTTAYMSTERYDWQTNQAPSVELHAIDASNPDSPVDRLASGGQGWGWLLGVYGDVALVTSGWAGIGIDVYSLSPTSAPVYQQTVRTNGWWPNGVSRQGYQLFLASGYWGVQTVQLAEPTASWTQQ